MIRVKSIIEEENPNRLKRVNYFLDDIIHEEWHSSIISLIKLIKNDSKDGWLFVFGNFLSSNKASVFYPVMTSFEDWNSKYSIGSSMIKFVSQQDAIYEFYSAGN